MASDVWTDPGPHLHQTPLAGYVESCQTPTVTDIGIHCTARIHDGLRILNAYNAAVLAP